MVGRLCWRVRYVDLERLPRNGALILAASHESFLDPPLVGSGVPWRIRYLARRTLFTTKGKHSRLKSAFSRFAQVIELDRDGVDRAALRKCLEALEAGETVLLFPEGARSYDGTVGRFQSGIGMLALRSGAPVVPVSVDGSRLAWARGEKRPRLFGGPVTIAFGEPTVHEKPAKARDVAARVRDLVLELRERVRAGRPG